MLPLSILLGGVADSTRHWTHRHSGGWEREARAVLDKLIEWMEISPPWLRVSVVVFVIACVALGRSGVLDGVAKMIAAAHGNVMERTGIRKPKGGGDA